MLWLWISLGVVAVLVIIFLVLRARANRNEGPVSIVIYRRNYREITEPDVRGIARRTLNINAEIQSINFDENTKAMLIISEEIPPVAVITSNRTYIEPDNIEMAAKECEDPVLRDAVRTHKAWVSVDAMGLDKIPERDVRLKIYKEFLGKIAAEFIDESCMILYAPAEGRYGKVAGNTAQLLAEGNMAELFGDEDLNAPIFSIEDSDKAVNAAIATAQKRLPEFIAVVESGRKEATPIVKARFADKDGNGEHMWAEAKHTTAQGIHAIVMNRPANSALPKKGDTVTIKLDDISDWMYVDDKGKPHGGFVERILRK